MTIDKQEIKALVDRVKTDRRFCADENHHVLADGVLALLAEIESTGTRLHDVAVLCATVEQERDQLKAENEALRSAALAAREFIMHEAEVRGLLDENNEVSHRHPRRQAAIASIDAAMATEANHG